MIIMANGQTSPTALGVTENLEAVICYVPGFLVAVILLFVEKQSRFVRFHAAQAILTSIGILVMEYILGLGFIIQVTIPIGPLILVLRLLLMYNAYQGKWFKLPVVGDIVEQNLIIPQTIQ